MITISRETGVSEDQSTQVIGQGLSARILAERGHHAEAEDLARSAVALAARTDPPSERADALLDLARVLAAADRGAKRAPRPPKLSTSTGTRAAFRESGGRSNILPTTILLYEPA